MKISLKKYSKLLISLFLLAGWGSKEDDITAIAGGGKKPSVNFYGSIIDNTETSVPAENITIAGKYKQIECYLIPNKIEKKDYNPSDNIARLDLSEIAQINISDDKKIYSFSNRDYLEIQIVSKDLKTINIYMIECGKKIYFDETNESGPIEREIVISAIKQINIEGYTSVQLDTKRKNNSDKIENKIPAQQSYSPKQCEISSLEYEANALPYSSHEENTHGF